MNKKMTLLVALIGFLSLHAVAQAQLHLPHFKSPDLMQLRIDQLLGNALETKRIFAPKFSLGDLSVIKVRDLAQILNLKGADEINRLFSTFRTGRRVFHIVGYGGTAAAFYAPVKNIANNSNDFSQAIENQARILIVAGAGSPVMALVVKLLTRQAANHAEDFFNGKLKNKIGDISSLQNYSAPVSPVGGNTGNGVALVVHI